jgi:hypothetical protein
LPLRERSPGVNIASRAHMRRKTNSCFVIVKYPRRVHPRCVIRLARGHTSLAKTCMRIS